jgi:hypothetical protein
MARDPQPLPPRYLLDPLVDGAKFIVAGNSAGLFGLGVALYYFGTKPPPIPFLLKASMLAYSPVPSPVGSCSPFSTSTSCTKPAPSPHP